MYDNDLQLFSLYSLVWAKWVFPPKFLCCAPHPQCNRIRTYSLWDVREEYSRGLVFVYSRILVSGLPLCLPHASERADVGPDHTLELLAIWTLSLMSVRKNCSRLYCSTQFHNPTLQRSTLSNKKRRQRTRHVKAWPSEVHVTAKCWASRGWALFCCVAHLCWASVLGKITEGMASQSAHK